METTQLTSITKLPGTRRKNGFVYRLVRRTEGTAMYSQFCVGGGGRILGFEVFKVRVVARKPFGGTLPLNGGSRIEDYERFPSNEDFGKTAWAWSTKKAADKCFSLLERGATAEDIRRAYEAQSSERR